MIRKMLEAVTKTAAGTGNGLKETMDKATQYAKNYNLTLEQSLPIIAREAEMVKTLHMDKDAVHGFMSKLSEQFGLLGESSDASAIILEKFGSRLEQVHVSGTRAKDIIAGFTDNLAKMDVVHRLFLSQQSGGPGGLAGGFKISSNDIRGKIRRSC